MAILRIFKVMNTWNALLWPLIFLRAMEMRTLVVGWATVQSEFNINYGLVMAGSVLTVLPLLITFFRFPAVLR